MLAPDTPKTSPSIRPSSESRSSFLPPSPLRIGVELLDPRIRTCFAILSTFATPPRSSRRRRSFALSLVLVAPLAVLQNFCSGAPLTSRFGRNTRIPPLFLSSLFQFLFALVVGVFARNTRIPPTPALPSLSLALAVGALAL